MNHYKYIVFDIDGVLARGTNSADEVFKQYNITLEEFFENWSSSEIVADFETGKITVEEFANARVKELNCMLKPQGIIDILTARKSILYNGVEELLHGLYEKGYQLACLSNTNILHWGNIEGKEIFDKYFIKKFLSHEIGLVKPKKDIYLYVLKTLQCQAPEILYFDDSGKNIEAAINLNIKAVQVKDFDDLSQKIEKF